MKPTEIKKIIRSSRIRNYELAEYLGMCESAFSKLFRKELTQEQSTKILNAIKEIKKEELQEYV